MSENTKPIEVDPEEAPDLVGIDRPLYDLASEYLQLAEWLERHAEENDGLIPDGAAEAFRALEGTVEQKVERCAAISRAYQLQAKVYKAQAEVHAAEAERLRERAGKAEAGESRMKGYIYANMTEIGIRSVKGDQLSIWIQKNRASTVVKDPLAVPPEYCRTSATVPTDAWNDLVELAIKGAGGDKEAVAKILHRGRVSSEPSKSTAYDAWADSAGALEIPGIKFEQTESLRIR